MGNGGNLVESGEKVERTAPGDVVEMLKLRRGGGRPVVAGKRLENLIRSGVQLAEDACSEGDAKEFAAAMGVLLKLAEMAERRRVIIQGGGRGSQVTLSNGEGEEIKIRGSDAGISRIIASIRERMRDAGAGSGALAKTKSRPRSRKGRKDSGGSGAAARRRRADNQQLAVGPDVSGATGGSGAGERILPDREDQGLAGTERPADGNVRKRSSRKTAAKKARGGHDEAGSRASADDGGIDPAV